VVLELDSSGRWSEMSETFSGVVLEKDGEVQLDCLYKSKEELRRVKGESNPYSANVENMVSS